MFLAQLRCRALGYCWRIARHASAAGLKPSATATKATCVACSFHGNEFRQQHPLGRRAAHVQHVFDHYTLLDVH